MENGIWRTVGGRRIFIKDGQDLSDAMKESGKFNNKKESQQISYKKSYYDEQMKKLDSNDYEDGTYDLNNLNSVSYDKGYQVTFSQIGDDYKEIDFDDKVKEFVKLSSDGKVSAGKFESTPEISFNFESKKEAIKIAKKYNQISIYDWKNHDEIKTGGTGKRT